MEPLNSQRGNQLRNQIINPLIGKTKTAKNINDTMNNSSMNDFDGETAFESSPRKNGS